MPKINYGLVVSDFDGTLVRSDGSIGAATIKAIRNYIADGGKFAISTGRMPMGILSRARELGLEGAVSCFQGAAIMDIKTGQAISDERMDNDVAVKICQKMDELGAHIHVYDLIDYYSNQQNETEEYYVRCVGRSCVPVEDMTSFVREKKICPYKILALADVKAAKRLFDELNKAFGKDFYVTTSGSEGYEFVEICNPKYDKGTAIAFLAEYYGVPLDKTIAIGDHRNDLPMLEKAGLGVAVGNAHPLLKEAADVVCEYGNDEDAVGKIIEKYGYKE